MNILSPKRIDEHIISILRKGPLTCLEIVSKINERRPQTTKQAVYSALRMLKSREQIIILKGTASLSIAWLNKMTSYLELATQSYFQGDHQGSLLDLKDKEKIKYYFNSIHKADLFWTQAYYLLLEALPDEEPVFLYNPHEWFLVSRPENETTIVSETIRKNHLFLLTVGGNTFLDHHVKKFFNGEQSQYNVLSKPLFPKNNYYLNVFGDFIIEAWIDDHISNKIEVLYNNTSKWSADIQKESEKILALNGKMRIVISRNRKKAEKIKRSLRKYFAIRSTKKDSA